MGLLENTKKIYNWDPKDGDYFLKESNPRRKWSHKLIRKKNVPFATVIVLIVILLSVFIGYYFG